MLDKLVLTEAERKAVSKAMSWVARHNSPKRIAAALNASKTAGRPWGCRACGARNKARTDNCSSCGAVKVLRNKPK